MHIFDANPTNDQLQNVKSKEYAVNIGYDTQEVSKWTKHGLPEASQ